MLILSRKVNESVVIDGRIIVKIVRVDGEVVKVGIEAPRDVPVHRQEVYSEIQKNNQEAVVADRTALPKLAAVLRAEPSSPVPRSTPETTTP